jgi:hypothetical protein
MRKKLLARSGRSSQANVSFSGRSHRQSESKGEVFYAVASLIFSAFVSAMSKKASKSLSPPLECADCMRDRYERSSRLSIITVWRRTAKAFRANSLGLQASDHRRDPRSMESSAQDDFLSFGCTEYRRPNYSVTVFRPFAWTEMFRVENDAE